MALFLLHLLTRFASSPSWFCARPLSSHLFARPFRSFFFLPSSSPFPLCPPYSFVFALPSPRLPFSCASARSPSRIWAIFPKKGRFVTNEQMTRGAEGTAIGAHCALARHYAKRVCLERNTLARSVTKERLFCYIAPFIWKKREIAERSEGRMGETNDGGKTSEPARARRTKQSRARPMEQDVQDDRWGGEAKPRERRAT